jgi:hypothetical protein
VDLYTVVVIAHVTAVILALAAHGVSMFAMYRVRQETDRARVAAILDLSSGSLTAAGIGLLLAFLLGIAAAIIGGHFSRFWPWASIIVLFAVAGAMTPLAAAPMTRVRHALGRPVPGDRRGETAGTPGTDEELATALAAIRPAIPAAIGIGGIVVLTWLMRVKPF